MIQLTCHGLPAAWINGWLAAVGATVLDTRLRLHWTTDGAPLAVLSAAVIDPVDALCGSWPDGALLSDLPIAEEWKGAGLVRRRVPVEAFVTRARAARGHPCSWTLSSTVTDLSVDENGEVAHAPFDPAGPGTIKWLHHRLMKLHEKVEPSAARVRASLAGQAIRVKGNGLGFDQTRLGSLSDATSKWIDPVLEELAFFGLAILPVRGCGADRRLDCYTDVGERQRGWRKTPGSPQRRFHWPAWRQPLDSAGIDALMDAWNPESRATWPRVGVHAGWRSVRFEPRGSADTTRAFGAERFRLSRRQGHELGLIRSSSSLVSPLCGNWQERRDSRPGLP